MVPNSELVSGRVTNWVLRDTQGRLRVIVGVAYASDVAALRTILEDVACGHPEVITDGLAQFCLFGGIIENKGYIMAFLGDIDTGGIGNFRVHNA